MMLPASSSVLGLNTPPRVDRSESDLSVNFVWPLGEGRALEARFVRRSDDYFIVYLSSHTGCNQACRFCHLTATRQVSFEDAALADFETQARAVLAHYDDEVASGRQLPTRRVHFNWMARGEPLLNPAVVKAPAQLMSMLGGLAAERQLSSQFNVSSIFPTGVELDAVDALAAVPGVQLFYSLYSLDAGFRKRWLPKARHPREVLEWLALAQDLHDTPVTLHWAVIDGENDQLRVAEDIAEAVESSGLRAKFNLVRYNPYSPAQGAEASEDAIARTFNAVVRVMNGPKSRVVPRVGFDVKASCGMFIDAR